MIDGISPILELEVQLFNIKKDHERVVKAAFIEGMNDGCLGGMDEEVAEDYWLLSDTFRKLTTGE